MVARCSIYRRQSGRSWAFLALSLLVVVCSGTADGNTIQKFAAVDSPGVLNVHVVPHTHDDVGWKKTVEQYFDGLNMTIDLRGHVKSIISTSLESVLQNPARTFVYVESKFFSMWWNQASDAQKQSMRYVVSGSKQWTFANGGWSMHDEACTHYIGMIDQTTMGHDFLKRHLGVVPKVGWQLDPFGHSSTQADLMTHKMGFDAIYFGRLDYEDLELRKQEKRCEGLWDPTTKDSNSNYSTVDPAVFFSLTGGYSGNYNPPGVKDFMFDELYCKKWDVVPLTLLNETQLYAKLEYFLQLMAVQQSQTQTQDILLTMGTDFTYRQAESYFSNIDLLIHTVMLGQDWGLWNLTEIFEGLDTRRVNIFYSTPDYYTLRKYHQTKQAALQKDKSPSSSSSLWTTKTDDFFPYSDRPHGFWSGYFTSRTAFKRFERVSSGFLQAARQLDLLFDNSQTAYTAETHPLYELEDALGVVQHHDAVSGTGKQHVADDYSKRLQSGVDRATHHVLGIVLDQMFPDDQNQTSIPLQDSLRDTLQYCPLLLNESRCEAAANTDFDVSDLYVVVYSPTYQQKAQSCSWAIRVPVSRAGSYKVERLGDIGLNAGINAASVRARRIPRRPDLTTEHKSRFESFWGVEFIVGPFVALGVCTYRLSLETPVSETSEGPALQSTQLVDVLEETVKVTNGRGMIVTFDRRTGRLARVLDQYSQHEDSFRIDLELAIEYGYYTSYNNNSDSITDDDDDGQNSGAYIFRPTVPNQTLHTLPPCVATNEADAVQFIPSEIGLEVHTAYGECGKCWIRQIVRVVKDQPWIEVEYKVGPIPIDDGHGKEVVARFSTPSLQNQGVFYTDSNARAFMKRIRDYRPSWNLTKSYEPIAGNYYPINAAIYIEDSNASVTLLTDRARGGGSILDGTVEVKIQRRTLVDDHRGVDEPLNETTGGMAPYPPYGDANRIGGGVTVSGVLRLMVGGGSSGARLARSVMDDIFAQPLIFVGSAPSSSSGGINAKERNLSDLRPSFSVLSATPKLPPNVFLVTLKRLYEFESDSGTSSLLLIRLAHQYGHMDDVDVMSKPVQVNLQVLLDPDIHRVVSVTEKTLSGNQNWTSFVETKYNWTEPVPPEEEPFGRGHHTQGGDTDSTTITLHPLDIRTFHVLVDLPEAAEELTSVDRRDKN